MVIVSNLKELTVKSECYSSCTTTAMSIDTVTILSNIFHTVVCKFLEDFFTNWMPVLILN